MSSRGRPPAALEHRVLDALGDARRPAGRAQRAEQLGEVVVAEELLAGRPGPR